MCGLYGVLTYSVDDSSVYLSGSLPRHYAHPSGPGGQESILVSHDFLWHSAISMAESRGKFVTWPFFAIDFPRATVDHAHQVSQPAVAL